MADSVQTPENEETLDDTQVVEDTQQVLEVEEAPTEEEKPQKPKKTKQAIKNIIRANSAGWLFILPCLLLMAIFTFYPIFNSLVLAFQENSSGLDTLAETKIGFGNFAHVITKQVDQYNFSICLINTVVLAFISVPVSVLLALLISVALNSIKPLQKAYQTIFFLPYLTNALAMGAVFATFFKIVGTSSNVQTVGLFNNFLSLFGAKPYDWLKGADILKYNENNALYFNGAGFGPWVANIFVVLVYEIWSGLPFKILIIFSALQSVNKQYYDAAKIDGASKNTTLWKITVPLISPMLSYLIVTGFIGAMKAYSPIVGIWGANMNNGRMGTIVGYIYACIEGDASGYAAAGSLILFAIIFVLTMINNQVSKKRVHY